MRKQIFDQLGADVRTTSCCQEYHKMLELVKGHSPARTFDNGVLKLYGAGLLETVDFLLARMFHELLSRDRLGGRATGQPQGVESEAYLNTVRRKVRHPRKPGRTAISAVAASHS